MRKVKYQGGLTKLITAKIGARNKRRFSDFIFSGNNLAELVKGLSGSEKVNMEVVSFSSSNDFAEQVLSILSYLKYVGIPDSWIVNSDGTHTKEQIVLLEMSIPFVSVFIDALPNSPNFNIKSLKQSLCPYFEELKHYANYSPIGKKLFVNLNHRIVKPTLFTDSDILFYEKAKVLKNQLSSNENGYFLPDSEWNNLDGRYMEKHKAEMYQVNAGFFLANREFSKMNSGLEFLKSCNLNYEYFTEQTVMHCLIKDNNFMPLDPRIFILNSSDQFDFSNIYPKSAMAIRHYTGPVRHKMWQQDWNWQLSLKK